MAKLIAVDDSLADLKLIESILASDHRVVLVQGSENVEARIEAEKPDLVLLDVVMPGRNGYEVLRGLRRNENTKNLPVLVISSKGEPTDIEWGKRQGANGYLTKPYTPDSLKQAVKGLLSGSDWS
ncbi:Alkaline phosphatase synthesis transcriptional regulatory protein PhoP [Calidithermus terrae]|uniref:Alkaline phosphatase synthesis transcriptional regulatory protein PhoP n=1 Tax=Calidithermus terrae TaxID=1408545 RepID=A0A399EWW3_9DEIN|nr:response regulator [Calidithermus terrae]RIH89054.1 Alkaline phosphatase synthesis transcriptional regulatory protein PhoP [Calidithermus terrae]